MRGWSLGQGTRQRYLSVRRQECSLPGTPSSLGLTVWGSFCCIRVSGTPVRWSLSLETPPSGRRLSDWGLSLDSSQSRVAPLWGLVPRTLSWSFTSLKGSRGCLSPKLVCARTWVSTRLHCTRPHTHTLAALPSREARVWQMPSCGQGWLGLDRTRLSVAPLASPLEGSWEECGAQDPTALPTLVSQKQQSGLGTGTHSRRQWWRGTGGVTAGAMPTHPPFSSPPPPLCEDCCCISQSHFLNPSLSQVQGRDLGAQGGKKCSPGSLRG